ncbi:Rha family transcriptional regulator [Flavobacterium psychrophilum]|nr:Rha family transcriptional regulator [Flavobacterium psychrophilum]
MSELSKPSEKITSLEISQLTGKPHSDLLKSIRELN